MSIASILIYIKKLLNQAGYDVKRHHPIYETVIYPLNIQTIIDIGANTGNFASAMRERFPHAQIYLFEPLADCFTEITKKFSHDKHAKAFPVALGDTKGTTTIEHNTFHPSSSLRTMSDLHKTLYTKTKDSVRETITIDTLDHLLEKEQLTQNILIKMDVQGFEDRVIAGGKKTISRASVVICETSFVQLYNNQPLFNDICQSMDDLGFSYYGDMGRHFNTRSGRLIYEDSLFIKKELISI